MQFALNEDQIAVRDMARTFAAEKIAPHALRWDEEKHFPVEVMREAAALGFAGLYVREDVGGSGLSRLDSVIVFEALARGDVATAAYLSIHNMCGGMIDKFGKPEDKERWLPDLCSMSKVFSYCLTEPGSGSDAAALRTRAERTNEGWKLNGTKAFISGGSYSGAYVCMVRTGEDGPKGISTVVVEDGAPGLSFGALEHKMGWQAQPTTQVQFDDCLVPSENLLGEEGRGFAYAMAGLDGGRLNIAAGALGGAQAALDRTLVYMGERKAFGKSLDQFQALQFKLADMETDLSASRMLLYAAASKLDRKAHDAGKWSAMAKRFVTDTCFDVANEALQVHGGYGYLHDYGVEKIVRDLRVHQILEGTNEIMRVVVARSMTASVAGVP